MKTLIYKLDLKEVVNEGGDLEFSIWKPSLFSIFPPKLPKKYGLYAIFLWVGVFKNKNFYKVSGFKDKELACSLLITPAYFKWPFMKKNDVQFIYVITKKEFRGQGLAKKLMNYSVKFLAKETSASDIWWVTDETNIASQKTALNYGFQFTGFGEKRKKFGIESLHLRQD